MLGDVEESAAQLGVVAELLGAVDEPEVELLVDVAARPDRQVRLLEVVDEVAGMDLEEAGQRLPRAAGEVEPGAVLDLGEVGLADAPSELVAYGVGDLGLGHLAAEAAGGPFEEAEAGDLFA